MSQQTEEYRRIRVREDNNSIVVYFWRFWSDKLFSFTRKSTLVGFIVKLSHSSIKKVKIQKYRTPRKTQNEKSFIKWENLKLKHIKRMEDNCHISDLVLNFCYKFVSYDFNEMQMCLFTSNYSKSIVRKDIFEELANLFFCTKRLIKH